MMVESALSLVISLDLKLLTMSSICSMDSCSISVGPPSFGSSGSSSPSSLAGLVLCCPLSDGSGVYRPTSSLVCRVATVSVCWSFPFSPVVSEDPFLVLQMRRVLHGHS